ncbi:type I methionyl aminopeptidase [Irregularibacter muris]|jgi:methionyl aminopeptidase|uniref:Methionine aminopeptidase n=1 Tax=Irregularibacter muris TaxID=1796619 RepID=A0AAE3HEI9_9FIRM|nr:type I methionyl aminopeptidase [Irregularibacter muris]MCR1898646.1 type I methionyl aminopeptidase [Irregularibacter muris]
MIILKSSHEVEIMRKAGKIVAEVHQKLKEAIQPGITTLDLDKIAEEYILQSGAKPAFKGYGGFPASVCTSINEEVVHGIPGSRVIEDGDIISIDIGAIVDGYYGDSAKTHPVGKISPEAERLIKVTRDCFYAGLVFAKEGYRLSDISHAIQKHVEDNGFSVVRDYVGHGIGQNMHEDPQIPNFGRPGKGPRLREGMILAIEPMVNQGTFHVKTLGDDWTVVTLDGKLSAHYEHTIAITEGEPEILTKL